MNMAMDISDIPKIYTALAEWISCVVYIGLYKKRLSNRQTGLILGGTLVALLVIQEFIGILPKALWIPGMGVALGIMFASIWLCSDFTKATAGYCLVRVFILAEFAASLGWQLYHFFAERHMLHGAVIEILFLVAVLVIVCGITYYMEYKQEEREMPGRHFQVANRELWTVAAIGGVTFVMSNLSYVYAGTPFSSSIAAEVFNIRTLIDLGGYAFLYAHHVQCREAHIKMELDSIEHILHMQYAKYRQSRENIEAVNLIYHDLKHQIALLQGEQNPHKRAAYLNEMEQGLKGYETEFHTGNTVLDTLLDSKSKLCLKNGITITCVADGDLLGKVHVMDLCTIFGNALDNAIECELQIPEQEKRLIHISVTRQNNFILIRAENYFEGIIEFQDKLPPTTKADKKHHGFGLRSIQYAARKYEGSISINTKNNWFELKIIIPL